MARNYRVLAVAACGLAILLALGTGAFFGALLAPHMSCRADASGCIGERVQESRPNQIERDRAGLPYVAERITSGPDAANVNDREQRDLAAQESMSVWGFWMLVVSAAGVATTVVGTGFLLWQIILTRKAVEDTAQATEAMREANNIARKSLVIQNRAWLVVQSLDTKKIRYQFDESKIIISGELRFRVVNTGKSAAKGIWFQAVAGAPNNIWQRLDDAIAEPLHNEFLPPDGFTEIVTDLYVIFVPEDKDAILAPLRAAISVVYDGGGEEPFMTECLWKISSWADGETGWPSSSFRPYFGKSMSLDPVPVFGYHRQVT